MGDIKTGGKKRENGCHLIREGWVSVFRLEQDRFHVIIELPAGRDTREQLTAAREPRSGRLSGMAVGRGSSDENCRNLKNATMDQALPLSTQ